MQATPQQDEVKCAYWGFGVWGGKWEGEEGGNAGRVAHLLTSVLWKAATWSNLSSDRKKRK
eukprot:1392254-Rhodomonas_salina.5